MKIDLIDIDNALKYYQISDIDYKNKCYKCVKDINLKNDFNVRTEEIYDILYTDKSFKIDTLWKKQNMIELFGEQYNPFITSVLVLLGWKLHDRNMTNKNYTDAQRKNYIKKELKKH